ncbi:MAG: primosomal protein [Bacteroidota bacterium]|nr:primosomal protein [Bacteroidota bacterium]
MSSLVTYVDVILPLPLPQAFTYAVPVDWVDFVKIGQRVIVQFGKNKFYSAIVRSIHHNKPAFEAKLIETIAEEEAIVTETQLKFWKWMADYYFCTEGEVMKAALPSGLKLSSETKIRYNENYEGDFDSLTEEEFLIVQALRAQNEIAIPQVQDLLKKRNVYPLLKTLFNLGIAISSEEIIEKFRAKTETYVKLNDTYHDEEKLKQLFDELGRAPKQVELLLAFVQLEKKTKFIKKSQLLSLSKADASVLKRLIDKKVFVDFKMEVSRLGSFQTDGLESSDLSPEQKTALAEINTHFETKNVVLLHGVTSSGKTNVYIEKIKELLAQDKQVLYLLPEIALTAQIINRLRKVFGGLVGIYHSKFNQNERVEIWNKILHNEYKIVIGARSGLFLPFHDLGLVIVDEEHDSSLKQMDPAPRYNGRDASIMLASMFNAKVILGTATPGIETFYNTEKDKYGLVTMTTRYGGMEMPEIEIADIRQERKRKNMHGSFTELMTRSVQQALQNGEQVILFLNRRGFANYRVCKTCNYVYKCKNCDVSLTYHKFQNKLICHYCGYYENVTDKCRSCGAIDLDIVGMGTEKIEDEIAELFPTAKISRLDYDATKTKHGHATVIHQFENREVDILVGTQMVTKGLDFDNVSLVGIISADQLINHPGFRSHERAFQLMMQVSGRAGRKNKKGKVIIQASDPSSPVIENVIRGDFKTMYETELGERRQFDYPPFARMMEITLQHKKVQAVEEAALYLANESRKTKLGLVLGPAIPFVSKVNNYYLREILIKSPKNTRDLGPMKLALRQILDKMKTIPELKSVEVFVDVDP